MTADTQTTFPPAGSPARCVLPQRIDIVRGRAHFVRDYAHFVANIALRRSKNALRCMEGAL
eukprot:3853254-Pleurochrysis_carterae.AAC.1